MEPRTEQLVASFIQSNDHLLRTPGVDSSANFECAVCGSVGRYSVRYNDPIQESIVRLGRDCDRYVRRIRAAHRAVELDHKLSKEVNAILAS